MSRFSFSVVSCFVLSVVLVTSLAGRLHGQRFELVDTLDTGFGSKWPASHIQQDLEFSPDGELIAACFGKKVVVHAPRKEQAATRSLRQFSVLAGASQIKCKFSPSDGSLLVIDGNRLWSWRVKSRELKPIKVDLGQLCDATISPDGKTIAIGHLSRVSKNAFVSLVNVARGENLKFAEVSGGQVCGSCTVAFDDVKYTPGGGKLVTDSNYYDDDFGSAFRIQLWHGEFGRLLKELIGRNSCCSPDGKLLAFEDCGPDGKIDETVPQVRLLDVATLAVLDPLQGEGLNSPAAWSHDGKLLAVLGRDNGARVWDVKEGKIVGQVPAEKSGILAATFSPDGTKIATSYNNGTIRIWQVNERQSLPK